MHLVQSVNHHGAADLCAYGLIYLSCYTHMCIHAGTLSDDAGGQVHLWAIKCTVISVLPLLTVHLLCTLLRTLFI